MKQTARYISYAAAPVAGLGLYAAARFPTGAADKFLVWAAIVAVTTAAIAAAAVLVVRTSRPGGRWLPFIEPPIFLTAASFLVLLLVETSLARYGLAVLSMVLLAVYFENLRAADSDRGQPADLVHLAHALDFVGLFFLAAFAFEIGMFFYVPVPLSAAVMAVFGAAAAAADLWRAGFVLREQSWLVAALGTLSGELFIALNFLPTSNLVNAAVAVVLFSLALQTAKHVLSGAGEFKYIRRELAVSAALVVILFLTARWI